MADGSKPQLYDLATDPGEAKNRAMNDTEHTEKLMEKVLEWKRSLHI